MNDKQTGNKGLNRAGAFLGTACAFIAFIAFFGMAGVGLSSGSSPESDLEWR